jgi:CHAT domain-containing protein
MSLWRIPDVQTRHLMSEFYRLLLAGESRASALRAAQLAIKKPHPHPLYWGAFICEGNAQPLWGGQSPSA